MKWLIAFVVVFSGMTPLLHGADAPETRPVYVIPIRDEIEESLVYVVRRGVKDATARNAQAIILDMDTPGGKVSEVEKIMGLLENFKGNTVTYVNNKAFSGGAFISVATRHIYMAPTGVIGAAAPVLLGPSGPQELPGTIQKKMSSALSALIRAAAQRNGYNSAVVDAMVKETDGLTIDGKEIVKKGDILTLTMTEATALYGKPPKPLLAEGVATDMKDLLKKLGYFESQVHYFKPSGMERIARFITYISPILMLIGMGGL